MASDASSDPAQSSSSAPSDTTWTHRTFALPKSGHNASEYEDALALGTTEADVPMRVAVADGATESVFARPWAETLARGFVSLDLSPEAALASAWRQAVPDWQAHWQDEVEARTEDLPWYAAAKAEEGAYATVLGLTLSRDGTWTALSVGDCLLLHFTESETSVQAWPVDDPEAFGTRPNLVNSRSDVSHTVVETMQGTWAPGDAFLLATDAVGQWLLRTDPRRALGWDVASFESDVAEGRSRGTLRNDDVTAVLLRAGAHL